MKNKISKTEAKEKMDEFFSNIKNKSPMEINKIKKLAMSFNIKLGNKKKEFCPNCFTVYNKCKLRIKGDFKTIQCNECGKIVRIKLKKT
ncbi:hypothetical protein COU57_02435 [Candidatus Pacearchaeota archaeon CG10_big_fil_rev_8_21_14_0_10_32_14]|nr:MAG: hypothetical protein COU57_02435 [Candidatus Pacearchaeota archaeon CG10_big_fil_rev_8_21_14_0_10_32_14]